MHFSKNHWCGGGEQLDSHLAVLRLKHEKKTRSYVGFESNFRFFLCPIFGVKGNVWEWSDQTICRDPSQVSPGKISWQGSKPSFMNHLTVPHLDVFWVYRFLKLVSGWSNDIHTLLPFILQLEAEIRKYSIFEYLMHLEKNVCVLWRYF